MSNFALARSRWVWILPLVLLVCTVMVVDRSVEAADEEESPFPSVKEALEKEIHGRFKLKKKRLQVQYDFRSEDQGDDFTIQKYFGVNLEGFREREPEKPEIEPGRLRLPRDGGLQLNVPFDNITYAMIVAKGVDSFSLEFRGAEDKSVAATFGGYPRITIDGKDEFKAFKTINLLPKKEYRFELQVDRGKVVGKLNGKKLLEKKLAKNQQLTGLGRLGFTRRGLVTFGDGNSGSSSASVSKVVVRGTLADDAVVVAANRDRAKDSLPPLWLESHEAKGQYFDVVTSVSQEVADSWQRQLDQLVATMLSDYPEKVDPLPPPPPPEPATGPGEGGPSEGDAGDAGDDKVGEQPIDKPAEVPADKEPRAKPFELPKLTVYVFSSGTVHDAYRGEAVQRIPRSSLPYATRVDGAQIMTFVQPPVGDANADSLRGWLLRNIINGVFKAMYRTFPLWWSEGHMQYYVSSFAGEELVPGVVSPDTANLARKYLDEGTEPVVSDLLKGWVYKRGKPYPSAICWAWVHFLRHGDDGKHVELAQRMHRAMRYGMGQEEAGKAVFPVSEFNKLYPLFKSYVADL
ncbi:MAG: hypothetical protein AAF581_01165 [Planctomycetota bacterium]